VNFKLGLFLALFVFLFQRDFEGTANFFPKFREPVPLLSPKCLPQFQLLWNARLSPPKDGKFPHP